MKKNYLFLFLFFVLGWSTKMEATHNRAGEILIRQIGALTIEATVVTYTKTSSVSADRDSVTIEWGDGTRSTVARSNGPKGKGNVPQGEELQNDIKKNIYVGVHTYAGFVPYYVITMTDPNRNGGILNINPPYSDNVQFSLSTTFTFLSQQFQGVNSTPVLLQPPIDFGCVGEVFIHNPNAFDIDGDSLFYQLTEPRAAPGVKVPNYVYPNKVAGGAGGLNLLTLNEKTGDLVWNSPQRSGEYNVTIMIVEFRQGLPIDTLIRDMQITILDNCKNKPPIIEGGYDICVVAGEMVEFKITASDPDDKPKLQKVQLSALGGPFQTKYSPATFTVAKGYQDDPLTGIFRWQTACEHISNQYYSVVFKAVDNFQFDTTGLSTLRTVRIKVIGPAPEGVQVNSTKGEVRLSWDNPYECDDVADRYFIGFSVWRRVNSSPFVQDTCNPGLKGKGFTRLIFKHKQITNNRYEFVDKTAERGITYCYRIQAEFARLTTSNNPYNLVEGLASKEVCLQLNRDIPLPLEVDVTKTDATNGAIRVLWNRPNPKDLDTILNKAPYRFDLLHSTSATGTYNTIHSYVAQGFASAKDTSYNHQGINTLQQHFYKIVFYVNNETTPLGTSPLASSVLLSISPTDKTNVLNWTERTPWVNTSYVIYRKNLTTSIFDSIGVSNKNTYRDEGLKNGTNYCYRVKSIGAYAVQGIRQPLINYSQELCAIPKDNVAPCPPVLSVKNICNDAKIALSDTSANYLIWNNVRASCATGKDAVGYQVFYTASKAQKAVEIAKIVRYQDTSMVHDKLSSLAGCYYVTAFDSLSNISVASNTVCVENCPIYELPNTFTPNADGQNDVFKPLATARFVAKVEFKVFNRWGSLVFQTENPRLEWNGQNLDNQEVAAGVYYYKCKVFEQRIEGIVAREEILSGYIEIIK
jgi:gliding motility-associated-like protein